MDCYANRTYDASKSAALDLGQWFSNTAAHYDFLSASPLTNLRSRKVFLKEKSPYQFASEYGVSYMIAPLSSRAINAIQYFQGQQVSVARDMRLTRLHAAWTMNHRYDLSASYIYSNDISGWGLGLRRVMSQHGDLYTSYRLSLSRSSVTGWYRGYQLSNEFLISTESGWFDVYGGIRHTLGEVKFYSSISALELPELAYFAGIPDLDFFAGIIYVTKTKARFTLQTNYLDNELKVTGKVSFRFDDLYPIWGNWFGTPRTFENEENPS